MSMVALAWGKCKYGEKEKELKFLPLPLLCSLSLLGRTAPPSVNQPPETC